MLSTAVMGGLGFIFWIICARLYPTGKVGVVTSLVSAAALATTFSALGLSNTLIRFLPTAGNRNSFISTAFILTAVASALVGAVTFYLVRNLAAEASTRRSLWLITGVFIVYVIFLTFNSMIDSVLIANRSAKYIFVKNSLMSIVKVGLPFCFVSFGLAGILASVVVAILLGLIYGTAVVTARLDFRLTLRPDLELLQDAKAFALGNYIGTIFSTMPATLVPLIVLARLGPSTAAFLYMPMMVVSFLNVVPSASAQSMFAEVSNDFEHADSYLWRSIRNVFVIMLPPAIAIICFASLILGLFGPTYSAHGAMPLRLLTLGSLIGALNFLGDSLLNMKKMVGMYVFMNAFNAAAVVLGTILLASRGLEWVAVAWIAGQALTVVVYVGINWSTVVAVRRSDVRGRVILRGTSEPQAPSV